MPLEAVAEYSMAEAARMVRRIRAGSGHGGRAKGYGGSKTENVFSHPVLFFL
jgi:hypothetical protein